jgi:hypothetical protein
VSDNAARRLVVLALIVSGIVFLASVFFTTVPAGRAIWNGYDKSLKKVDDATTYEKQKKVEDTARAMVASYEADMLTYNQYKASDSQEERGWSDQAKMRANKTASTYNNFILQNSFIWAGNVPVNIRDRLPYLQ